MLRIVENRGYNEARYNYEKSFKERIETLSNLPNYDAIEHFAQTCIDNHTGYGYSSIIAISFMDIVGKNKISDEQLLEWAKKQSMPKEKASSFQNQKPAQSENLRQKIETLAKEIRELHNHPSA